MFPVKFTGYRVMGILFEWERSPEYGTQSIKWFDKLPHIPFKNICCEQSSWIRGETENLQR